MYVCMYIMWMWVLLHACWSSLCFSLFYLIISRSLLLIHFENQIKVYEAGKKSFKKCKTFHIQWMFWKLFPKWKNQNYYKIEFFVVWRAQILLFFNILIWTFHKILYEVVVVANHLIVLSKNIILEMWFLKWFCWLFVNNLLKTNFIVYIPWYLFIARGLVSSVNCLLIHKKDNKHIQLFYTWKIKYK